MYAHEPVSFSVALGSVVPTDGHGESAKLIWQVSLAFTQSSRFQLARVLSNVCNLCIIGTTIISPQAKVKSSARWEFSVEWTDLGGCMLPMEQQARTICAYHHTAHCALRAAPIRLQRV